MIYSHVSGLFESLVRSWSVFDNHRRLLLDPEYCQASPKAWPLVGSGQIKTLHANAETLIGETCLTSIGANHESEKSCYDMITVASLPIRGLHVALGMYGVVGLRILYTDGSKSAWLGSARCKWCVTYEGHELERLQILFDVGYDVLTRPWLSSLICVRV